MISLFTKGNFNSIALLFVVLAFTTSSHAWVGNCEMFPEWCSPYNTPIDSNSLSLFCGKSGGWQNLGVVVEIRFSSAEPGYADILFQNGSKQFLNLKTCLLRTTQ